MEFVVVKDPVTKSIEVATKGPKGDKGDPGTTPDLSGYQTRSEKGNANGYAGLGGTSKVPVAQLPVGTTAGTVAAGDDARLGIYRQVQRSATRVVAVSVTGAGTYVIGVGGAAQAPTTVGNGALALYLDPAAGQLGISGYSTKLRMIAACAVNDAAVGATLILGLYPVGTPGGTGSNVFNPNLGTAISASQITFTTPAANSKSAATVTADFDCPTAGWYCFGVEASGAMTTNSVALLVFQLQVRNV